MATGILRPALVLSVLVLAGPAAVRAQSLRAPTAGAAPAPAALAAAPSARLSALLEAYDILDRKVDPIGAAAEGDLEARTRLPDDSPAAERERTATLTRIEVGLQELDLSKLTPEERLNRTFLLRLISDDLEGLRLDAERINFDAYDGFHLMPNRLADLTRIETPADARAYLTRLAALPSFYETEIANARRGARSGFTQPRPTVEVVIAIVRRQLATPADEDVLLKPVDAAGAALAPAERRILRGQVLELLRTRIRPRQAALLSFLQDEYLPKARASLAARDLPDGEAYYRWAVAHHTTTDLDPDAIHRLGLEEVARIRAEMSGVIRSTGFTGGFPEFLAFLRTDPRFYLKDREALVDRYARFNKRVDGLLPREFGRLPRLPFTVREIPRETEESATTAYYQDGAPALGVAGSFMVNTSHLDQRPLYEIPALALHESEPGHHLQIALAQELTNLPRFRRNAYLTAYVEGWALYAEQIGEEMGAYQTPYERFGRLSYEMWRACRLVADTGIHWLRWSRDQARACFLENTALSPKNIDVELDRYIGWPGQALAYKIGELEIMRLRKEAQERLGERFDVRRFHDAVLLEGPLPLDLLRDRIHAFIETEGRRP